MAEIFKTLIFLKTKMPKKIFYFIFQFRRKPLYKKATPLQYQSSLKNTFNLIFTKMKDVSQLRVDCDYLAHRGNPDMPGASTVMGCVSWCLGASMHPFQSRNLAQSELDEYLCRLELMLELYHLTDDEEYLSWAGCRCYKISAL